MKRNQIVILMLDDRQWTWAAYPAAGRAPAKPVGGVVPAPDPDTLPDGATALTAQRDALLAQWREHGLSRDGIRLILGMPATDALMRVVVLPTREPEELREMSVLQIEKISPFNIDDVCVDYEILSTDDDSSRAFVVGMAADRIERLGNLFREIGIKPDRVDLTLCAWWSMVAALPAGETPSAERVVHLFLHDGGCDGFVIQHGELVFVREMARHESLSDTEYATEIATQTAYSLAACDLDQGPAANTAVQVHLPEALALPCLTQALQAAGLHDITSRIADPVGDGGAGLAKRALAHSATTLDLAPPAWHLAEIDRQRRRRLALMIGSAAIVWMAAVGGLYGRLWFERQRLDRRQAQDQDLDLRYERATNIQVRVRNLLEYTDQSRSALETLREISALQPPGIDLSSYDYRKGNMIRIAGEAETAAAIFDFKNQLDNSPLFAGTDPPSVARSARNNRETFRMTINLPGDSTTTEAP